VPALQSGKKMFIYDVLFLGIPVVLWIQASQEVLPRNYVSNLLPHR